jgi:cytochrome c553
MKIPGLLIIVASLQCPVLAQADNLPIASDAPASFKAECGSCHLAFPPSLLIADDWQRVMANLDNHYGDNASVDDKTRQEIERFLLRHGGSAKKKAGAGNPPRITTTDSFKRRHREVPAAIWTDPTLKSVANCAGCHPRAEQGRYGENEIRLPGGRKWED